MYYKVIQDKFSQTFSFSYISFKTMRLKFRHIKQDIIIFAKFSFMLLLFSSQYHQHFTISFCTNLLDTKITKPNCKQTNSSQNTFTEKSCSQNVGEIDTLCQFYQQFMSSFCANFLST